MNSVRFCLKAGEKQELKIGDLIKVKVGYAYIPSLPKGPLLIVDKYQGTWAGFPMSYFRCLNENSYWIREIDAVETFFERISSSDLEK